MSGLKRPNQKHLMLFSGRAHPELANEIADGAYIAAGSTITADVGPGDLAVSRSQQRNVPGWVARKRPGTKTARAAEAAQEQEEPS